MMEHKAFPFDYWSFDKELRPLVERSLATGESELLRSFIALHWRTLKDPYEGRPLSLQWEEILETRDPHQYGDHALTKYYDPTNDIGLGPLWDEVQKAIT